MESMNEESTGAVPPIVLPAESLTAMPFALLLPRFYLHIKMQAIIPFVWVHLSSRLAREQVLLPLQTVGSELHNFLFFFYIFR